MSPNEKHRNEVDGVDSIDAALLQYYTTMTEHHRGKISVIASAYLLLSQLMLTTKVESIRDAVGVSGVVFTLMLGSILSLLIVGILHHAVNIATISAERLNILRDCYYLRLPAIDKDQESYELWRVSFERGIRDPFPISFPSLMIAGILVAIVFFLTIYRFYEITSHWLSDSVSLIMFGGFAFFKLMVISGYIFVVYKRARFFYKSRKMLGLTMSASSKAQAISLIGPNVGAERSAMPKNGRTAVRRSRSPRSDDFKDGDSRPQKLS